MSSNIVGHDVSRFRSETPVLLIVFNRPETTLRVFDQIKKFRPKRLYIAGDGARPERIGELERVADVRNIISQVDWECEVKTLFRDVNLGCKFAVSGALDWFFECEEEGIILEDDVLPLDGFFRYCEELLAKYREDHQIGMISGCNLVSSRICVDGSYFFSHYNHIWGWASWRRAWKNYDLTMEGWPLWGETDSLSQILDNNISAERYWRRVFESAYRGEIDTWDYQWTFSCWKNSMLSVLPVSNQTLNLGFGEGATHTIGGVPEFVIESHPLALNFPLSHAERVEVNPYVEKVIFKTVFERSLKVRARNLIGNVWRYLRCLWS